MKKVFTFRCPEFRLWRQEEPREVLPALGGDNVEDSSVEEVIKVEAEGEDIAGDCLRVGQRKDEGESNALQHQHCPPHDAAGATDQARLDNCGQPLFTLS